MKQSKDGSGPALAYLSIWIIVLMATSVSAESRGGIAIALLTLPWTPLCVYIGDRLILNHGFSDTQKLWNILIALGALCNTALIYCIKSRGRCSVE
ncbi:MAG: hypothetical protein AAB339_00675 [Elusimicrobiota bacterium]